MRKRKILRELKGRTGLAEVQNKGHNQKSIMARSGLEIQKNRRTQASPDTGRPEAPLVHYLRMSKTENRPLSCSVGIITVEQSQLMQKTA